jgi:predicted HTH domain antitoxin
MSIQVEFPDEILLASRESRATFVRNATIYTLGHLYEQGKISSGFAARVLECDRVEVYRLFTENGFSVIDYSTEEYDQEAQAGMEIASSG